MKPGRAKDTGARQCSPGGPGFALDRDPPLALLIRGDNQAFAHLVGRYKGPLYHWLCKLMRDAHAAEDLVQDTFVRAYQALGRLRPDTHLRAWLFRIAHNAYANWVRSRQGRNEVLPEAVADRGFGPELQAQGSESQARLEAALLKLPEEWRCALLLRTQEDMSFRELAQCLGATEETARWRVFKARQKLLDLLRLTDGENQ